MTKKEINKLLSSEGISSGYSGKTKTFYVSKIPNGITLINLEKSGFNCKVN